LGWASREHWDFLEGHLKLKSWTLVYHRNAAVNDLTVCCKSDVEPIIVSATLLRRTKIDWPIPVFSLNLTEFIAVSDSSQKLADDSVWKRALFSVSCWTVGIAEPFHKIPDLHGVRKQRRVACEIGAEAFG
jgi:hypothetical protein